MPTPIVVLNEPYALPHHALAYAAQLAKTMAVPLRVFQVDSDAALLTVAKSARHWEGRGQPMVQAAAGDLAEAVAPEAVTALVLAQGALVVVMGCPTSAETPPDWWTNLTLTLLQTTPQPLLLVPAHPAGHVPPLRIALAADGEPFTLVHEQRAMHALLLTLPVQLTVLHTLVPNTIYTAADALQTVLACRLTARYHFTDTKEVKASSAAAGILLGLEQSDADLLVLIVRQRSLNGRHFEDSTTAQLLRQSPVPMLLLLAVDG